VLWRSALGRFCVKAFLR